jgi:monofunctional biosynthetic peptidoglycan transglycosylase
MHSPARVRPPFARYLAAFAGVAVVVAAIAAVVFITARPAVERRLRARIAEEARSRGLAATIGELQLRPTSIALREVVLESADGVRVLCREARLRPRLSLLGLLGRAASVEHERVAVDLPAGLRLAVEPSRWVAESGWRELRLRHDVRGETLELSYRREGQTTRAGLRAEDARLSGLVDLRRHGCIVADLGTLSGGGEMVRQADGAVHAALQVRSRGFALAPLGGGAGGGCAPAAVAERIEVEADAELTARPASGSLRIERFRLSAAGVEASGRVSLEGGAGGPEVDLDASVERLEFARLLAAAGVEVADADLGSAVLALRVRGPLADPAALVVEQRLDFRPPSRAVPAIERLRAPFVHRVAAASGRELAIEISPESADFVVLDEVPPLFVQALLLGEDAGFWGHRGIDLGELPAAVATNLARGSFARGASTITQQLAKNLFLSREKRIGRKLAEASLALLLDATLGKRRVLEIYINVIEWGPDLYGLRPAARHYFGREPGALTPKQMAFLVSMIPGPVKYQRSIESGEPTPFFEGLMASLLAKLHATGALDDAAYAAALVEPLGLATAEPAPDATTAPDAPPPDVDQPPTAK